MKFRFCGDLDCPDWLLAEISILSKLSSVKMKLLCGQIVKDLRDEGIDYAKVGKLTQDAKFEDSDVKASIAALTFIISSAAKHSVDAESLNNELQQLGLPKESATSLCKVYADSVASLQEVFARKSLRASALEKVDWRVDYLLSSSALEEIGEPCVQLRLHRRDPVSGELSPVSCSVSGDKFRLLLRDLKLAYTMMENLG